MPIIVAEDLKTHLYPEITEIITRGDTTITDEAIATAVDETKMFLSRFNRTALFGTDSDEPTFTAPVLKTIVKNIAAWHLLRLANVTVDLTLARTSYEDAISRLKQIQSGVAEPDGWPLHDASTNPAPIGDSAYVSGFQKRNNNF